MSLTVNEDLKNRFKDTVRDMEKSGKETQRVENTQFYVTTNFEGEPKGTIFLTAIEENNRVYVLCMER